MINKEYKVNDEVQEIVDNTTATAFRQSNKADKVRKSYIDTAIKNVTDRKMHGPKELDPKRTPESKKMFLSESLFEDYLEDLDESLLVETSKEENNIYEKAFEDIITRLPEFIMLEKECDDIYGNGGNVSIDGKLLTREQYLDFLKSDFINSEKRKYMSKQSKEKDKHTNESLLTEATKEENKILYDFMQSNKRTVPANVQAILDKYGLEIGNISYPADRYIKGKGGRTTSRRGDEIFRAHQGNGYKDRNLDYTDKIDYEGALNAPLRKSSGNLYNYKSRKDIEKNIGRYDYDYSTWADSRLKSAEERFNKATALYDKGDLSKNEYDKYLKDYEEAKKATENNEKIKQKHMSKQSRGKYRYTADNLIASDDGYLASVEDPNIKINRFKYIKNELDNNKSWRDSYVNQVKSDSEIKKLEDDIKKIQDKLERLKKEKENPESNHMVSYYQDKIDRFEKEKNALLRKNESLLTEKQWDITLKSGKALRRAVEEEDEKEILKSLRNAYNEIIDKSSEEDLVYDAEENLSLLEGDESLIDDYKSDSEKASENYGYEDSEELINSRLADFWDLCDSYNIWVDTL